MPDYIPPTTTPHHHYARLPPTTTSQHHYARLPPTTTPQHHYARLPPTTTQDYHKLSNVHKYTVTLSTTHRNTLLVGGDKVSCGNCSGGIIRAFHIKCELHRALRTKVWTLTILQAQHRSMNHEYTVDMDILLSRRDDQQCHH